MTHEQYITIKRLIRLYDWGRYALVITWFVTLVALFFVMVLQESFVFFMMWLTWFLGGLVTILVTIESSSNVSMSFLTRLVAITPDAALQELLTQTCWDTDGNIKRHQIHDWFDKLAVNNDNKTKPTRREFVQQHLFKSSKRDGV